MIATLSMATKVDPIRLLALVREEPDLFDSLWYAAFPVVEYAQQEEHPSNDDYAAMTSDITAIMRGEKR